MQTEAASGPLIALPAILYSILLSLTSVSREGCPRWLGVENWQWKGQLFVAATGQVLLVRSRGSLEELLGLELDGRTVIS